MFSCALRHRLGLTVSGAGLSRPMYCLVLLQVPDDVAVCVLDGQRLGPVDQAALGVVEVRLVVERQRCRAASGWRLWSLRWRVSDRLWSSVRRRPNPTSRWASCRTPRANSTPQRRPLRPRRIVPRRFAGKALRRDAEHRPPEMAEVLFQDPCGRIMPKANDIGRRNATTVTDRRPAFSVPNVDCTQRPGESFDPSRTFDNLRDRTPQREPVVR